MSNTGRIEKAFQSLPQLLQTIFNTIEGIAFVKDKEGRYHFINEAYAKAFNVDPKAVIGKDDHFVFPPEVTAPEVAQTIQDNDQRIMKSKKAETVEESGTFDGTFLVYRTNKAPLIDEEGNAYGICGIGFDITKQKKLEEERDQLLASLKTANETKDKLFSVIAHDLRRPFNGLLNIMLLLDEKQTLSIEALRGLQKSSKDTYLLLENLLAWSQAQMDEISIKKTSFPLARFIEECMAPYEIISENKNIRMNHHIPADQHIFSDRPTLHIILSNLINNAIKFSEDHGEINIQCHKETSGILLTVKDSGIGMSANAASKLFIDDDHTTTFGTHGEKGTGIGLGLCAELIKKLDGKIWVKSEQKTGSTFFISIPNEK